ncbi:hypothetical protein PsAD46_02720 [Pseudovibrio sp. Ad46]|nr:hypothetical protein PsAD46_02720 [Pseudovibrio sp. Ad46]
MAYPDTFPCPNSSSVFDKHICKSRFYCRYICTCHRVIPYSPGPFPSNHAVTFEVRFTGPLKGALRLPIAPPSLRQTDGRSASSPLRRHGIRIWEEFRRGISFSRGLGGICFAFSSKIEKAVPLALGTGSPLRSVRHDGGGASEPDGSFSTVFPHVMRDLERLDFYQSNLELP